MLTYEASLCRPKHSDRAILIVVSVPATPCWKTSRHVKIGPYVSTWTGRHCTKQTVSSQSGHYQRESRQVWNQHVRGWIILYSLPLASKHWEIQCFPNTTSILSPWRHTNRVLLGSRDWLFGRSICNNMREMLSISNIHIHFNTFQQVSV